MKDDSPPFIAYIKEAKRTITLAYRLVDDNDTVAIEYGATVFRREENGGKKNNWTRKEQRNTAIQRLYQFPVRFSDFQISNVSPTYRKFVKNAQADHPHMKLEDIQTLFIIRREMYKRGVADRHHKKQTLKDSE